MSERAQLPTGPSGVVAPEGVGGVLDDDPRPVGERGQVDGQAGVVHRDQRVDVGRHRRRVEVERGRVDVDEGRRRRRRSGRSWRWRRTTAARWPPRRPGPSPAAAAAPCRAAVPLEKATAWRAPTRAASAVLELVDVRGPGSASRPCSTCDDGGDVVVVDRLAAVRDHGRMRGELVRASSHRSLVSLE